MRYEIRVDGTVVVSFDDRDPPKPLLTTDQTRTRPEHAKAWEDNDIEGVWISGETGATFVPREDIEDLLAHLYELTDPDSDTGADQ